MVVVHVVQVTKKAKGIGYPGTRITGVAAVWYRCWKTNLGPLKEQHVLKPLRNLSPAHKQAISTPSLHTIYGYKQGLHANDLTVFAPSTGTTFI